MGRSRYRGKRRFLWSTGDRASQSSATAHPLPNDAATLFCTDPPYSDLVPYADLSDFYYVWLSEASVQTTLVCSRTPKLPKDTRLYSSPEEQRILVQDPREI